MKRCIVFLVFFIASFMSLYAQKTEIKVAFIGIRNLDIDPRTDYVGGIIQGLILYDLTRAPGVILVDRYSLDKVLREQELQLSGLIDNTDNSVKVGKLLGADFLVFIDYITIVLHSRLIRAEIFLDGKFVGYTTGNITEPFIIEKVKPGKHTVRVHLGKAFGIIKLPEVIFMDWSIEFDLAPGEREVLRDETTDFNSLLYEIQNLRYEGFYWNEKYRAKVEALWQKTFVDRNGKEISVSLALNPANTASGLVLSPIFIVNGEKRTMTLVAKNNDTVQLEAVIGIVKLVISIDQRYNDPYIHVSIERTDIWQGMFME